MDCIRNNVCRSYYLHIKPIIMKKLIILVVIAILVLQSCATGYGCRGRSKDMTGTSGRFKAI